LGLLKFERRDIILIAGIFLIVLGITQYVPFHYSALIGVLFYIGIKVYVEKRRQSIQMQLVVGYAWNVALELLINNAQNVTILKNNSYVCLNTEKLTKISWF
jgi:hypothetical protein